MNNSFLKVMGWATIIAGVLMVMGYIIGQGFSMAYLILGIGGIGTGIGILTNYIKIKR